MTVAAYMRMPAPGSVWLAKTFAAERERLVLWVPVGLGLGIAGYFSLAWEPPVWIGPAFLVPALLAGWIGLKLGRMGLTLGALAIAVIACGFAAAQLETWRAAAPLLHQRLDEVTVAGKVMDVEPLPSALRLTLAPDRIDGLKRDQLPRFVRVTQHDLVPGAAAPAIGDRIEGQAALLPLPPPDMPGGFDFQRQAYFRGLGAVGYFLAPPSDRPGPARGFGGWVDRLRQSMTTRILAGLPGSEGAVAAALITGERAAIPANVAADFRNSGLAHLLVIAGLHMTLLTGCAFFLLRAALALIPPVALRYPIKKWAAAAALLLAALYLVISGAAVPTQRAFTMCALALGAILFDRQLFSMRALAVAATLVLVAEPVALEGVSFQMSFSAVVCLVAFYESAGRGWGMAGIDAGPLRRIAAHMMAVALTTLVATLGTAPFAVFHFGRFAWFSVLANVAAVPVTAFWIIPWGLVACLLMPLHLENVGLVPMGFGIRLVEAIGHWAAHLPHAVLALASPPLAGLVLVTAGGLWLCLWSTTWRYAGVAPILLGIASLAFASPPDMLISADGSQFAAQGADGRLYLMPDWPDSFAASVWLEAEGDTAAAEMPYEGDITLKNGVWHCAHATCSGELSGRSVTLLRYGLWPDEPCPQAALVISLVTMPTRCAAANAVTPEMAQQDGAHAIWFSPSLRILSAAQLRGTRPWVVIDETPPR